MGHTFLKICIFTNHFYPEDFKVNDIAFEFAKKGYKITVVTAIPDYPYGKYYKGYSLLKRRKERINGVQIIRLPIIPRGKGKNINLILNYLSYFVSSLIFTFFYSFSNKFDLVFTHLTSPFFIGLSAVLLKRKQHIPLIFWVLDLWPESLIPACGISNKYIINPQIKLVQYVYSNCDKILIGSQGFRESICEKGNYNSKLEYFPNWSEAVFSQENDLKYCRINPFINFTKDDFVFLFAGNIGGAQNLDCLIDIANELKDISPIKFVFLGDGSKKEHLIGKTIRLGLNKSVFFLGRYPLDSMPVFMKMADVLMVSLKDDWIYNLTIPSKVQFYMAQEKPILAMLNGDGADLINAAQCGIAVKVDDLSALKYAVKKFYYMSKKELKVLGNNGKNYYEQHFRKEERMNQLETIFQNAFREKR
jgi:glycosyltransferase involved in cell wall biosynthesis